MVAIETDITILKASTKYHTSHNVKVSSSVPPLENSFIFYISLLCNELELEVNKKMTKLQRHMNLCEHMAERPRHRETYLRLITLIVITDLPADLLIKFNVCEFVGLHVPLAGIFL